MGVASAELQNLRLRLQQEKLRRQAGGDWTGGVEPHREYRTRPIEWMTERLGIREETIRWSLLPEYADHKWDGTPDPLALGLEKLALGESCAASSGTNTGKTYVLAAAATLWFLACFEFSNVISISPKFEQQLKNMWKEIGEFWPRFHSMFPQAELMTGTIRMLPGDGQKEVWTASAFGAGVGKDEELAQNLKGFHRAHMLWIIEEGPGVPQPIVETIIKTATGVFNPIIMLGNPAHQYDTLALFSKRSWVHSIRISALDFPNVVCDREIVPGARTRQSVLRDLDDAEGNENDPFYMSQVRGLAPAQSQKALIRRDWLDRAAARYRDALLRDGPPALGVDPADVPDSGDGAFISRWKGAVCTEVVEKKCSDANTLGAAVFQEANDPDMPVSARHIAVDSVGVGAGTVNECKRLGMRVRALHGAARPVPMMAFEPDELDTPDENDAQAPRAVVEAERYLNLRAQIMWRLREDLRLDRIGLPADEQLFRELLAFEYVDTQDKIAIISKKVLRTRLGRSPGRAEAVAYGNFVRPRKTRRTPAPDAPRPVGGPGPRTRDTLLEDHYQRMQRGQTGPARYGGGRYGAVTRNRMAG